MKEKNTFFILCVTKNFSGQKVFQNIVLFKIIKDGFSFLFLPPGFLEPLWEAHALKQPAFRSIMLPALGPRAPRALALL